MTDQSTTLLAEVPAAQSASGGDVPRFRIWENVLALSAAQVFTWTSALFLTIALPRYLGPTDLGRFYLAFSLTEVCSLIAALGTSVYLTKEVARRGTVMSGEVTNALIMRLPLVGVAVGAAIGVAFSLGYDGKTMLLIYLFAINILFVALTGIVQGTLLGLQDMRPVALVNAISKVLLTTLIIVFIFLDLGAASMVIAWTAMTMTLFFGYLGAVLKRMRLGGPIEVRTWPGLTRRGLPFFVWDAALLVYGKVDIVMLSIFSANTTIALYGASYRIIAIPVFIPTIVITALFSPLSRLATTDLKSFDSLGSRGLKMIGLITLPMAAGTIVLAPQIIDMFYDESFSDAAPLIAILALHMPLVAVDMLIGSALNALDRQGRWAATGVAAAALNPAMNLALIPLAESAFDNGAIGAAITTVATELFMLGMGIRLLRGRVLSAELVPYFGKCLLACVVMAAAVWVFRDLFTPAVIVGGALVYGAVAAVLGLITRQDAGFVTDYVARRLGLRKRATA